MASDFKVIWNRIDYSGDRKVSLAELEFAMADIYDARALFEKADADGDGILTFAELAFMVGSYRYHTLDTDLSRLSRFSDSFIDTFIYVKFT
jgi:hypothetical protein